MNEQQKNDKSQAVEDDLCSAREVLGAQLPLELAGWPGWER